MRTLGETIRHRREELGWSVIQLARRVGVSRNAIYQWEADEVDLKMSNLLELSKALNLPMTVFAAAIQGLRSVDAELAQMGEAPAEFLSESFFGQIDIYKKMPKT